MPVHDPEQVQGADEVVVVVLERFADGLAHGLEAGEVDDGVDPLLGEDAVHRGLVHEVDVVEVGGLAAELGNPAQRFLAGVHQVVDDHHLMAGFLQGQNGVGADVAGATCDQNFHVFPLTGRRLPRRFRRS